MPIDIEHAVMRKVAWRLIPFLSLGYLINALDRFNISIAALTMNKALGLSATTYGLAAGAFFWSYVLFQFPASAVITRLGARRCSASPWSPGASAPPAPPSSPMQPASSPCASC